MKKLFLFAAAAIALAACSQSEEIESAAQLQGQVPVEFGTYVAQQNNSRIDGKGLTSDNLANFGVFGYHTGSDAWSKDNTAHIPNLLYNKLVTKSGTDWTYENPVYWQNNGDKYSFFAYAPYAGYGDGTGTTSEANGISVDATSFNNEKNGYPVIKFENLNSGIDLLYAEAKDITKQGVNEKVKFQFKHASAQVGYDVYVRYVVDEVNNAEGKTTSAMTTNTSVTLNKLKITAAGKEGTTGTLALDGTLNVTANNSTDLDKTIVAETSSLSQEVTATDTKVTGVTATPFVCIPPTTNQKLTITATADYTILHKKEVTGGKDDLSVANQNIEGTNTITLEPGKKYKIIVVIGMTSVKVEAKVEDWEDAGNAAEVDVPNNFLRFAAAGTIEYEDKNLPKEGGEFTCPKYELPGGVSKSTITVSKEGSDDWLSVDGEKYKVNENTTGSSRTSSGSIKYTITGSDSQTYIINIKVTQAGS